MENFKEIAEKCLAGELSGTFVFQNGQKISSSKLQKYDEDPPYGDYPYYISHTCTLTNYGFGYNSNYNVIDFIPDNMQKKIEIDIPEGKVPLMEQTENGVVITWIEKELTYDDVCKELQKHRNIIGNPIDNSLSDTFHKKVWALRKLTNIRNYFGKPKHFCDGVVIKCVNSYCGVETGQFYFDKPDLDSLHEVVFAKREHAEQAIKMLGDELKYLFEPW